MCKNLAQKYSKVKLLQHPDKSNHGAAASRNLGIKNAIFPYISFLDADDFFLPNRFTRTFEVFRTGNKVDGVYEAIGAIFDDQSAKELWSTLSFREITTVTKEIKPEYLFKELLTGKSGYFSPDGLTVLKDLFSRTGLFNEDLMIMEDTDMIYKLSAKGALYPGNIEKPVAIRRVHKGNRITYLSSDLRKTYNAQRKLWQSLYGWALDNLSKENLYHLLHHYAAWLRKLDTLDDISIAEFVNTRIEMLKLIKYSPRLLFETNILILIFPSKQLLKKTWKDFIGSK